MSTPTFTMFHADCVGNAVNCLYSHKVEIVDADTFRQAVRFDHVYAAYRDNYRSVGNFISANALPVDCDNDHSDDPADWITPEDVAAAFPNVAFVVHYSRHHLLMKRFRSPRPRFHEMPDIAAGKKPIAFGAFSFYSIVDRAPISVSVLTEAFSATEQVGYLGHEYLDAKLLRTEAIKVIQVTE